MVRAPQPEGYRGRSSQFVLRRFGRSCVCGPCDESSASGHLEVLMTQERWLYSGPRESLLCRAGYRSMRLKVVTDFGGYLQSGTRARHGGVGTGGGLANPGRRRPLWLSRPPCRGVTSDGKEDCLMGWRITTCIDLRIRIPRDLAIHLIIHSRS